MLTDAGGGLYAYAGPHGTVTFVEPGPGPDGRAEALGIGFERHPRGRGLSLRAATALAATAVVATVIAAGIRWRRAH